MIRRIEHALRMPAREIVADEVRGLAFGTLAFGTAGLAIAMPICVVLDGNPIFWLAASYGAGAAFYVIANTVEILTRWRRDDRFKTLRS